jgi:hypothetical protein
MVCESLHLYVDAILLQIYVILSAFTSVSPFFFLSSFFPQPSSFFPQPSSLSLQPSPFSPFPAAKIRPLFRPAMIVHMKLHKRGHVHIPAPQHDGFRACMNVSGQGLEAR